MSLRCFALRTPDIFLTTKSCPLFPIKPTSPESPTSFDDYSPHSSEYKHTYTRTQPTEGTLTLEQLGLGSNASSVAFR